MPSNSILVVDDFEPWRRVVLSIIRKEVDLCVAGEASDGLEAVQKAEVLKPDLVLLDIGLPKLNGMDVARQMRSLALKSRILFLSEDSSPDVVREALRIGVGFVLKTDTIKELLPAVKAVVQGRQFLSTTLAYRTLSDPVDAPTTRERRNGKARASLVTDQGLFLEEA